MLGLWRAHQEAEILHLIRFKVGEKSSLISCVGKVEMEITMDVHHFDGRGWGPSIFPFDGMVLDGLFSFLFYIHQEIFIFVCWLSQEVPF